MSQANPAFEPEATSTAAAIEQMKLGVSRKQRTLLGDAWRRFRKHRLAMIGSFILIFLIVAVLIGPTVYTQVRIAQAAAAGTPLPKNDQNFRSLMEQLDFLAILSPPSAMHPFGTDDLGRDQLARALFGGRISLLVGVVAMLIAVGVGTVVGVTAGFIGGLADNLLMRLTDLFLSLPQLPLLLLTVYLFREKVTGIFGPENGIFLIVVVMVGGLAWMSTARVVRATALSIKQKEYIEAATCLGIRRPAIMARHLLPNAISPIIVAATLEIGNAIISESTLSFLGIGFPPDTPTWGRLVTDGSQYLQAAPHLAIIPGALIFITVLSINFIGDGLRDALDPRSRL